jgi:peptide/nickel transport system permease protein
MGGFLIRRLLAAIPVCLAISVAIFAMIHLVPGDPAIALVGPMHTPESLAAVRRDLGLTLPIHVQYLRWLAKAAQGDLGTSIQMNRPVLPEVLNRFSASLLLACAAFAIAVPVGICIGVLSALMRGSPIDRAAMAATMAGISIPPFYLGMLLILVFSVDLRWLPSGGMFPVTEEPTPRLVILHLILPALALASAPLTVVARMVRTSVLDVLGKDYIRTAYAKGLKRRLVLVRHGLKNALIPVTSLFGLQVGYLISATALVEVVFGWPGLGSLIVQSILTRDLPVVQGAALIVALVYLLANLAADVLQLYLDPRLKFA